MSSEEKKVEILTKFIKSQKPNLKREIRYKVIEREGFSYVAYIHDIKKNDFPKEVRNDLNNILFSVVKSQYPGSVFNISYKDNDVHIVIDNPYLVKVFEFQDF